MDAVGARGPSENAIPSAPTPPTEHDAVDVGMMIEVLTPLCSTAVTPISAPKCFASAVSAALLLGPLPHLYAASFNNQPSEVVILSNAACASYLFGSAFLLTGMNRNLLNDGSLDFLCNGVGVSS
jgi:hypothetical protein